MFTEAEKHDVVLENSWVIGGASGQADEGRRWKKGGPLVCILMEPALKGEFASSCMAVKDGEPLELCEECGSPLIDGSCQSCEPASYREGTGPTGTAPMTRSELDDLLDRSAGQRTYGSLVLSMQQEEGMAPLRKEIDLLVEQFSASPELKNSVRQNSGRSAVKLLDELGPTKAAMTAVAQEFLRLGRSLLEVSVCLSRVHPKIGRLRDLVVSVRLASASDAVIILVDGRERARVSADGRLYRKLRITLLLGERVIELRNAFIARGGWDEKRVAPLGPSKLALLNNPADQRSFELFKLLKEARLSSAAAEERPATGRPHGETTAVAGLSGMMRRYSISKLPMTERLLREEGLLHAVEAEYRKRYEDSMLDARGRSPRKLAEEALVEACERLLPAQLVGLILEKRHLKPSAMSSLIVKSELVAWRQQGMEGGR
jgi:hypothetical protein